MIIDMITDNKEKLVKIVGLATLGVALGVAALLISSAIYPPTPAPPTPPTEDVEIIDVEVKKE